ncbi:MAG: cyanoexosortase A [Symploca sp. SIO3C6]|uniref:Cyanoexosortase A n=1 Tax=Symploca sp. SIO1C4 TaxID=2607765 RepID=A0A6B3NDV9_9CYAN|nr:cyanoexosortase A [Symploca sp. SIO3C6]NER28314.1 cyanoexosortase A [Symploca sp. SIO1C4]NET03505.1 cyanoexosortase A [Symploca sp. SIO2B6]
MKATFIPTSKHLTIPSFWLLAIAVGLIAIHQTLTWRGESNSLAGNSILFWMAISSMVWDKRHSLNLESRVFPSFLGASIIALILLKSSFHSAHDIFLNISPLLSAFAVALLASGFKGLKQYWQELTILVFLIPPPSLLAHFINLSVPTAKFSEFLLWYSGWEVFRDGILLYVPNGVVKVASGCSGTENMSHLLGLAVIFLMMFSSNRFQKIIVPLVALALAFLVNGVRVAILAVLSSFPTEEAFNYWHHGNGSGIFPMITVVLFGLFCWLLLQQQQAKVERQSR